MGTQFLNVDVGRRSTNLTNKLKSTMFRFVTLFALVAVAFAEPEADSQFVYSNVAGVPYHGVYNTYAGHVVAPVVKPVVPVVKAAVPGVPEDTDSVKLAKKQHELAQEVEKVAQKVAKVQYVAPYTTYAAASFPYVNYPVAAHVIAKREADSEADPAVFYNAYNGVYPAYSGYSAYPYTTAVAGYPYYYNKVVAGVPYTTGYTYSTPVFHSIGKREAEADSDAALYYNTYGYNYAPYTYNYGTPYTYNAFPYRNVYGWY